MWPKDRIKKKIQKKKRGQKIRFLKIKTEECAIKERLESIYFKHVETTKRVIYTAWRAISSVVACFIENCGLWNLDGGIYRFVRSSSNV